MITATALSKSFVKKGGGKKRRVAAVTDVSFTAEDGKITGLLGPNGAGKSTSLRMLIGLIKTESGRAVVDGIDVAEQPLMARRCIGYLPHNAGVYPRLTAKENILYFADMLGMSKASSARRLDELVDQLSMDDFIHRRCEGFSQGQRTKVALARALVHKPRTLILDEPTNGLDVMATRSLRKVVNQLAKEGHCILFSSHIMQEVAALCDHIAIISEGRIAMSDTLSGILRRTEQSDLEDAFVVAIGEALEPSTRTAKA